MLDKLPSEVILTISNFLSAQDKQILITTCRHLFNLISKTNLYSMLNLYWYSETLEVIGQFQGSRYPGTQVKEVFFDITVMPDQLLSQLSTIFPNITRVSTATYSDDHYRKSKVVFQDRYTKGPMLQWRNTLQKFNLRQDWPEVLPLLKTTTFPRLTELKLSQFPAFEDKKQGYDTTYFLSVFKNVPLLKKLSLEDCALDLDLLEEIHTSCPHLESLHLLFAQIIIREQSLPSTIKPAISFLRLSISSTLCFDINGLLLEYITRKYPSITRLMLFLQDWYTPNCFIEHHGDGSGYFGSVTRGMIRRKTKDKH